MWRARAVVNRCVLAGSGLAALAVGGWLTVTGTGAGRRLPPWWPAPGAVDRGLLAVARQRGEGWWTPVTVGAAVVLTVLLAQWFRTRIRGGPSRPLSPAAPECTVRPQALAEALALRAATVPGVARSRARVLPGTRLRLEVRLRVWLRPGVSPRAVLPALCAVTAEAGESAAPYTAHTRLRLSAVSHRVPRVR
ncbi:hypothetical protein ACWEPI_02270 [Streptomyces sp. NPDC004262]